MPFIYQSIFLGAPGWLAILPCPQASLPSRLDGPDDRADSRVGDRRLGEIGEIVGIRRAIVIAGMIAARQLPSVWNTKPDPRLGIRT
ncbi:uncharacterized protein L3040_001948 [Drepanopeziza brunnea f. sp. 'multigermtubi']|uniref:uncharacterized protein n=1 Tax=Drepanopeziza brunnea f. sp. 'multigermtubi' TaxID=698441 RepID=UPI0023982476|nr:hypothetical protein L3040_001948 [Drepanopeziza brunnea f. sp. 'multigermtubi']